MPRRGDEPTRLPSHPGYGPVQTAVRLDVGAMGELRGVQPSLAETAFALAAQLDAGAGMATAAVARELRATLAEMTKGRTDDDATAAFIATLATPELAETEPEGVEHGSQ